MSVSLKNRQDGLKSVSAAAVLVVICCAPVIPWSYPKHAMDDAFITFRYAANLAEDAEFTYNVSEDPVEGYTGVLFPLTLAGLIPLGIDPVLSSRIIRIGSFYVGGATVLLFFLKQGVRSIV